MNILNYQVVNAQNYNQVYVDVTFYPATRDQPARTEVQATDNDYQGWTHLIKTYIFDEAVLLYIANGQSHHVDPPHDQNEEQLCVALNKAANNHLDIAIKPDSIHCEPDISNEMKEIWLVQRIILDSFEKALTTLPIDTTQTNNALKMVLNDIVSSSNINHFKTALNSALQAVQNNITLVNIYTSATHFLNIDVNRARANLPLTLGLIQEFCDDYNHWLILAGPDVTINALSSDPTIDHVDNVHPRPKQWFCQFCGWDSHDDFNDYLCQQCHQLRPFAGGSATMKACQHCQAFNLTVAHYCEWCGDAYEN